MVVFNACGLERSFQKSKEWLCLMKNRMEIENDQQAYIAVKSVLHAIRDRLNVNEAVQFAEQLPMIMKGFYYESYVPAGKPEKFGKDEFFERIINYSIGVDIEPEKALWAVVSVIREKTGGCEMDDVQATMPSDMKHLFD